MDIVLFSTADWDSKYWTNKQHVASRLVERGHRVLYVETIGLRAPGLNSSDAQRMVSRVRRGLSPVRQVKDNLWVLSPLTIPFGHRYPAIAAINSQQLRVRIKHWISSNGIRSPLIWTYQPYILGTLEYLEGSRLVYHCVDDLGAIPGIDSSSFYAAEQKLLARADLVFVTSHRLRERCAAVAGSRVYYFANVADIEHFAEARVLQATPPELDRIPRPRIGYVGVLSERKIDFELLTQLARARPDWHFVFIGGRHEGQANKKISLLAALPNVHLLGWRHYSELPRYLSGMNVGLLPQQINNYTRAMFPMKFFEYLAAGLPVVSTPLEALRDFSPNFVSASSAKSFADAIQSVLDEGPSPLPLDSPVLVQNSWDSRMDEMLAIVGSV